MFDSCMVSPLVMEKIEELLHQLGDCGQSLLMQCLPETKWWVRRATE